MSLSKPKITEIIGGSGTQVETGSYLGTGSYMGGQPDKPIKIYLDFKPKYFKLWRECVYKATGGTLYTGEIYFEYIHNCDTTIYFNNRNYDTLDHLKISISDDNVVEFFIDTDTVSTYQSFDAATLTYKYIAIS